jgi:hypothetical protein
MSDFRLSEDRGPAGRAFFASIVDEIVLPALALAHAR